MASPALLSVVLVAAAIFDQAGVHSLRDHSVAMYAPHGKQADPDLLYGLLYVVAALNLLLWLLAGRAVRASRRSALTLTVTASTITAALAVLLLVSSEYGAQIFPPLWGILAALPLLGGVGATVLLLLRRDRGQGAL